MLLTTKQSMQLEISTVYAKSKQCYNWYTTKLTRKFGCNVLHVTLMSAFECKKIIWHWPYLDTCPRNDVILFSRKGLGLGLRYFKYVFGQATIRASVLDRHWPAITSRDVKYFKKIKETKLFWRSKVLGKSWRNVKREVGQSSLQRSWKRKRRHSWLQLMC